VLPAWQSHGERNWFAAQAQQGTRQIGRLSEGRLLRMSWFQHTREPQRQQAIPWSCPAFVDSVVLDIDVAQLFIGLM